MMKNGSSMRGKLGDKVRLEHIYEAILEIEIYLVNKEFADFMENSMMRFACIKQMEIIGEAANHISDETKSIFANPLYSYLSTAKGVNVRWALGCKAGNPDLATPKIGSFYFPNIEV
jgi:hypothetical protein